LICLLRFGGVREGKCGPTDRDELKDDPKRRLGAMGALLLTLTLAYL
jgi:hypothetical protein